MSEFFRSQPEYDALVVENELDFRSELIYFIEALDLGITVVAEASNFDDAKARLNRGDIDLLITDINLTDSPRFNVGDRDGLELAAYAKDIFNVPSIFLTAFADFDPAVFNIAAACDPVGFIQKQGDEIDVQTRDHISLAVRRLESIRRERESARQLADIGEHVGSAQLFIDEDGVVFDFNTDACELLERSSEEIADQHWEDIIRVSPPVPESAHPLVRAFQAGVPLHLPSIALELPQQGLLLASVLLSNTEHLRRPCKWLVLRNLSKPWNDLGEWQLSKGNCLVLLGTSPALTSNKLDLSMDSRSLMLELQSGVLARFPASVSVTVLQPKTLAVILENTPDTTAHNLMSTFIIEMESVLAKRHPGIKLHAGIAGLFGHASTKDVLHAGFTALEDAQRDPTKRVRSAPLATLDYIPNGTKIPSSN